MGLREVTCGQDVPNAFNVIIEIPMHAAPVKYEVDKATGVLCVDRFVSTSMFYPANYGYIPHTLSEDGDPVDVLVLSPVPLIYGAVIQCRTLGMLKMTDESGVDAKLLAVPIRKLTPLYDGVEIYSDLPQHLLDLLVHFFSHYKDLEVGKWVKINGWEGPEVAHVEIMANVERYKH